MSFWSRTSRNVSFKRLISILIIQAFLFSNLPVGIQGISFAASQENTANITSGKDAISPDNIVIPRECGLVKSKFKGSSGKTIVHIQDAHCNYEAQSNIAKILENLVKNNALKFVAVEGADGVVDTSWFKSFPDDEVRKEVATYFMKKGEITGPEFLSITTDYPIKLYGAETRSYYIENLNAFTSSYSLKDQTEKYFNNIRAILNNLKLRIYNEELKSMDTMAQDYESKSIQFNDYIRFLQALAEKHKINLRQYGNFFKLVNVLIYEKKIDFNIVDKERGALIDEMSRKAAKDTLTELVSRSMAFKVGKISSAEYYDYIKNLSAKNGIELFSRFPNVFNYIIYNGVYSKIENEKLFRDIKELEAAVKEKLFQNDDQRTLEKLSRHIDTLIGLVNIKLLNGDFEYYKTHRDDFTHEVFAGFIRPKSAQYGLVYTLEEPADAVAKSIPKLEEFYAIAIKRDKALVDNTLAGMNEAGQKIAVLVTGGFHSEGIAKLLEKEDISYVVVCPAITKDTPTPYIQILTNQRTPFEEILVGAPAEAKRGMLAPVSLAWAINLSKIEFSKVAREVAGLKSKVEGAKDEWLRRHLTLWLTKALNYTREHRMAQDKGLLKDAYRAALEHATLSAGFADDEMTIFVNAIISEEVFHKTFDSVYEASVSKPVVEIAKPKEGEGQGRGAIRTNGGKLTAAEHGTRMYGNPSYDRDKVVKENTVNGVLAQKYDSDKNGDTIYSISEYRHGVSGDKPIITRDPARLTTDQVRQLDMVRDALKKNEITFVIVRGLKKELEGIVPDLVITFGVTRRTMNIDEGDFLYLLSRPDGARLVVEAIKHEMAHIDDPDASEVRIEKKAPTYNVRMALLQRDGLSGLEANFKLAINGNEVAYSAIVAMPAISLLTRAQLINYFESNVDDTVRKLPEDIFGFGNGYDVRGNAQPIEGGVVDLTPANLYAVGKLLATHYANPGDKVLLTGDIRLHTPILRYCMGLGIASTGVNVEYVPGFLTTGAHNLLATENSGDYKFMVQVSGSHGVSPKNGLKIKAHLGKNDPQGRMVLEPLYAKSLEGLYWKVKDTERPERSVRQTEIRKNAGTGNISPVTGTEKYVINMLNATLPAIKQDEIVVIDPRAGAAGSIMAGLLEKRGFEIIDMDEVKEEDLVADINRLWQNGYRRIAVMLNKAPDGNMGRGIWDPSLPEALEPSQKLIRLINGNITEGMPKAIGAVFDGDADRISAILEDGRAVPAFEMTLPYYQRFLVAPDNQEAMIKLVKAGSSPIKIVCDVRANSKLLSLIDNVNRELKRKSGITDRNMIEGYFISTGYPPQLSFMQHRIAELENFVGRTPALKNDVAFMKQFDGLKRTYFTAEASGHNFFHISKTYPDRVCDCAISGFVALMNIRETMGEYEAPALGLAKKKARYELTELFDNFPPAYSSRQVNISIPNNVKIAAAKKIGAWMKDHYAGQLRPFSEPVKENDYTVQPKDDGYVAVSGFKIQLKDGRTALVGWSNTSEKLITIFEGRNLADLISITGEITDRLRQEGAIDVRPLDQEIARLEAIETAEKKAAAQRAWPKPADVPADKRVVALISGGESAGVNDYFALLAEKYAKLGYSFEVVKFGLEGLVKPAAEFAGTRVWIDAEKAAFVLHMPGAVEGTARVKLDDAKYPGYMDRVIANLKDYCRTVVVIGGNDHMFEAAKIAAAFKTAGVNDMAIVALPKSIDYDAEGVYMTGADTAGRRANKLVLRAAPLPGSNKVVVSEIMGRDSGFLAVSAGDMAPADLSGYSGAERRKMALVSPTVVIAVPEWSVYNSGNSVVSLADIVRAVRDRMVKYGAASVVVSEGFRITKDDVILKEILKNPFFKDKFTNVKKDAEDNLVFNEIGIGDFITEAISLSLGKELGLERENNLLYELPAYSFRCTEPGAFDMAVVENAAAKVVEMTTAKRGEVIARGGVTVAVPRGVKEIKEAAAEVRDLPRSKGTVSLKDFKLFTAKELAGKNVLGQTDLNAALSDLPEGGTLAASPEADIAVAIDAVNSQSESSRDMKRFNICVIDRADADDIIKRLAGREHATASDRYVDSRTGHSVVYLPSDRLSVYSLLAIVDQAERTYGKKKMGNFVVSGNIAIAKDDALLVKLQRDEKNTAFRALLTLARQDAGGNLIFGGRIGDLIAMALQLEKGMSGIRRNVLGGSLSALPVPGNKETGVDAAPKKGASVKQDEETEPPAGESELGLGAAGQAQAGETADEARRSRIYDTCVKKHRKAFEGTIFPMRINKTDPGDDTTVVLLYDTDLAPDAREAVQAADTVMRKYLGDSAIEYRASGAKLLDASEAKIEELKSSGKKFAVVTVAGEATYGAIKDRLETIVKDANQLMGSRQDVLSGAAHQPISAILRLKDGRMPVMAVHNIALNIGFNLGEDRILTALNASAVDLNNRAFTRADIEELIKKASEGALFYLEIRPAEPIDTEDLREARESEEAALRSM